MDEWAAAHSETPGPGARPAALFSSASVTRQPPPAQEDGAVDLSSSRAYSLALSPQIMYTCSALLSQLVSSRAYRQLEFLALGSSFVLSQQPMSPEMTSNSKPSLTRIPFSREAIFSSTLSARSKRTLMKFLKFVVSSAESEPASASTKTADNQTPVQVAAASTSTAAASTVLSAHASTPLATFLASQFSLDPELQSYVLTLTLDLPLSSRPTASTSSTQPRRPATTVSAGMAALQRHLASWGQFGPGFAAVYPKWGGGSEVAQVACRAGAVGGGVYMLGRGVKDVQDDKVGVEDGNDGDEQDGARQGEGPLLRVVLDDGTVLRTRRLVRGWSSETDAGNAVASETVASDAGCERIARLVAVVGSPMAELFESTLEGAPKPAVAVVSFPESTPQGESSIRIYAFVHSSDTGECPAGQSKWYSSHFFCSCCPHIPWCL